MAKVIRKISAVVEGRLIRLAMEIEDRLKGMDKADEDNSAEIIDELGAHLFVKTGKSFDEKIVDRLATGVLYGDW